MKNLSPDTLGISRCFAAGIVLFSLILLTPAPAAGDVIHLVNGGKLTGRIVSETDEEIVVEKNSIRTTLLRSEIDYIERSADSSSAGKTQDDSTRREARAKELFESGRYREAAREYKKLLASDPSSEENGRMLKLSDALAVATENLKKKLLQKSKDAAGRALELDAANVAAKKVLEEIGRIDRIIKEKGSLPGKFLEIKTKRFIIYHHQPYIGERAAADAEKHLDFLIDALRYKGCPKPKLKKKLKVRIYRDHKEFVKAVGDIGRLFPALTTSKTEIAASQSSAIGALRHEITHCLVHAMLPSMPVWIHEGLATGGYQRAKYSGYRIMKNYIDGGKFLPFDEFLKIRTMDEMEMSVDSFYFQSRLAMEFLIFGCGGMEKFHLFARRVREIMVKDVNAYAKEQGKSVTVRNVDWLEKPVREMLDDMYGYPDLSKFDSDMKKYAEERLKASQRRE